MKSNRISNHINYYIEHAHQKRVKSTGSLGLAYNTIRSYASFKRIWADFEAKIKLTIEFKNLDKSTVDQFIQWLLEDRAYSMNYIGQLLKHLKTIARDAEKYGIVVHPYVQFIESIQQRSSERIIVTFNKTEIDALENLKDLNKELYNAKSWLLIGLAIGQRVSDLLNLQPSNFRKSANGGLYVDLIQQKTQKSVTIGIINPVVISIINHEFPKEMGLVKFNKAIKELCRLAGMIEPIVGNLINPKTHRKERGIYPKYKLVSSHIMRRSFATNYFGKIETPILMSITGHTKETTFLNYIGKHQNKDAMADAFMDRLSKL